MLDDGYVPCTEVSAFLAKRGLPGIDMDRLATAVTVCPKRRFQLSPCGGFIRATQGHSIQDVDDAQLLTEILDAATVPVAVHGTRRKCWDAIRDTGLCCGNRNHIHIATGEPSAAGVVSGARADSAVLVFINVALAMSEGVKFFRSSNGVVLTRGVDDSGFLPAKYFADAVHVNRDGSRTRIALAC
jgi:RNA:NAD 2'-phosphotransferase (TPT1/KptA family)